MIERRGKLESHLSGLRAGVREGLRAYREESVLAQSQPRFLDVLKIATRIEGFTSPIELSLLYHLSVSAMERGGVVVEIGSYLGRSTVVLAHASLKCGGPPITAIDPHTGELTLGDERGPETLDRFLENLRDAGVDAHVRVIQLTSLEAAKQWTGEPVALLFVDGLHTREAVRADVAAWSPFFTPSACVVFDDFFVYPCVRTAVRELRAEGALPGVSIVVGKMFVVGPQDLVAGVPTPLGARVMSRFGDRGVDLFNSIFRDRSKARQE